MANLPPASRGACRGLLAAFLELLVKLASGTRDIDAAGDVALAVFHAFYDPRGFAALGTVGAFGSVHYLVAACCLGDFCHCESSPECVLWLAATAEENCGPPGNKL